MKVLMIYGHPNPASFNHAIQETLAARLTANGHEVRVRDLYELGFDPVLKAEELAGFSQGRFPADIQAEHAHVLWADVYVLISPIWWGGLTSIMRGYCDRVFCSGFAYRDTATGPQGLLTGKKGYIINTLGAPLAVYDQLGYLTALRQTIGEIIFGFCAITPIGHKFFGSVTACSDEERAGMLAEVEAIADQFGDL